MNKLIIYSIFFTLAITVSAQNTRSADTPKPPKPQYQAAKKEKKSIFGKKKKANQLAVTSREEFRANVLKRQKANAKIQYKVAKVERKEARKGESFFGHKRPPKKRPPGKQKFCKVCKMRH
ncbi:hypothetical protein [Ekhidna sp.]